MCIRDSAAGGRAGRVAPGLFAWPPGRLGRSGGRCGRSAARHAGAWPGLAQAQRPDSVGCNKRSALHPTLVASANGGAMRRAYCTLRVLRGLRGRHVRWPATPELYGGLHPSPCGRRAGDEGLRFAGSFPCLRRRSAPSQRGWRRIAGGCGQAGPWPGANSGLCGRA